MRITRLLPFAFVLVVALSIGSNAQAFPKVSKFVVPDYPAAAMAIGVEGDVQVEVEVDQNGEVISATATSGHPLLRPIAELTSKKWEFTRTPGNHFIVLKFMFRLPRCKDKTSARLVGDYILDFRVQLPRLDFMTTYEVTAQK